MSEKAKRNPFLGIVNYFREVRAELKKVVWPTFKQIKNNTVIVIICLILVGVIIFVFDLGFKTTLGTVINTPSKTEQIQNTRAGDMPQVAEDDIEQENE